MVGNKSVFWKALVLTIVIFIIGFLIGFAFESARENKLDTAFSRSEISLFDEQLRNKAISDFNVSCGLAINNTFAFADRIYLEALQLEKYDGASNLKGDLKTLHKRYDLLRFLLWDESVKLKEKCNGKFHTIVYLYDYDVSDAQLNAEQAFYAKALIEIKNKNPRNVLLIPIAANLDLEAINMVAEGYNISSMPALIIDEKKVKTGLFTVSDLESTIFEYNK